MTQWDFQNKGKSGWTGTSSFVLEVPLRHLRPSVIYSVPCDRILQRAYWANIEQDTAIQKLENLVTNVWTAVHFFANFEVFEWLYLVQYCSN